jgi:hypothetical protein
MADRGQIIQEFSERYLAAVEKEQAVRDSTFISDIEIVGNIKVYSLTPKLFATLTLMKCPLVMGGNITAESVLSFLWVIKVKTPDENRQAFFQEAITKEDFDQMMKDINEYFETAFQDIPPSREGGGGVPYYSSMVVIVDFLASEYGWTEETIINMPYKRLFQYMKLLGRKHDPSKAMFNKSDSVKSEMIKAIT